VGYAREQLVHVLAVIAKRRTLECDKKLLFDSIFGEVTQLLGMDPLKVHNYMRLCYIIITHMDHEEVGIAHELL